MEYEPASGAVRACDKDWRLLESIAQLKKETLIPALGLWRNRDDDFLWQDIIKQVVNRGGARSYDALQKSGQTADFYASLSPRELLRRSGADLGAYVRECMTTFRVGRFRDDNALSVVANSRNFIDEKGHINLRRTLDELDCSGDPIGRNVQVQERRGRDHLMKNLVFYQRGQEHHAKRKPPSDLLFNIGFARTLLAFDTRMKRVFGEAFGISISEQNYEPIEDWFLTEAYPKFQVTPSEFDRIIFQHYREVLKLTQ